MKNKYIYPQTCCEEIIPARMLAQSGTVEGTGQDLSDPVIVNDFNL